MFTNLKPVWLVAQREIKDQFRDWRITFPMIVLVFFFPILMNEFSKQAVDFLNQYNTNFILERLVPFAILIIGFFPLTVSLVIALESFVGEKERGTIEPLLSAPLDDWQLYSGKLLVSAVTPLIASYLSIAFYLLMISQQENLELPPLDAVVQLLALTAAHAFLMVSAAIVISVQSTSVKAANLLASFIVIPVAILMQGETVVLVWGDRTTLWLTALGVTILALLLIRLGIAHFQREYMLGREIDSFNASWIWNTFKGRFFSGARSPSEWFRLLFKDVVKPLLPALLIIALVAGASVWIGYDWVAQNMSDALAKATPERLERIQNRLFNRSPSLTNLQDGFSASFLFLNNARAVLAIFLMGLLSFSVLGILAYVLNVSLIGGLFALLEILGVEPLPLFLAGVLPHGIFELPALMVASAATLRFGALLVTPQVSKSMGEVVVEQIADWVRIFVGIVVPLLAIAALIEAHVTPVLLSAALK